MKKILLIIATVVGLAACPVTAAPTVWYDGTSPLTYALTGKADPVVSVAIEMFAGDIEAVTGKRALPAKSSRATVSITQLDRADKSERRRLGAAGIDIDSLRGAIDGFAIATAGGRIYIAGTNGRGTAYGILELSRLAGVSPWVWWGDAVPRHQERLELPEGYGTLQGASVEMRGIFLNDEDWSLRPWSCLTHEPGTYGKIGPATYRRVFELLLRLRGNAIWPAMHEGTEAFFADPRNKEVADSCGIIVGTSHCEPLLRNNVGEWDVKERGPYNYITNREGVQRYWIERLQQVSQLSGNIFTIGMRGIHDGSMEGVRTTDEKFSALQQVIDDQQQLISQYIGDASRQPQVFVPYKEVLDLYRRGLRVPPYVTLMWCDDNYGYMTRLSSADEQQRPGGAGIYYHLSYWGRPHDHLWLTTTQPGLIYNELRQAYDHNVRRLWIANVHDPKVAGYDLELFLDMAWDMDQFDRITVGEHCRRWLCRQFGEAAGEALYPAMREYYRLTGQRRPEFMGWSQVELDKRQYDRGLSPVRNTTMSQAEAEVYLGRYQQVYQAVDSAEMLIRPEMRDAYFAAVRYPVESSYMHAVKMLEAQRARTLANGSTHADPDRRLSQIHEACGRSQKAYMRIRELTDHYNSMCGGKWRHLMCASPRDLPVFGAPSLPVLLSDSELQGISIDSPRPTTIPADAARIARAAHQYTTAGASAQVIDMLGHTMQAVALPKGESLTYTFDVAATGKGTLYTATIPTQAFDDGDLRYTVSIDGGEPTTHNLKEPFRSEQWKENVLRGQALKSTPVELGAGRHTLTITALDDHIVVDAWMIDLRVRPGTFYLLE